MTESRIWPTKGRASKSSCRLFARSNTGWTRSRVPASRPGWRTAWTFALSPARAARPANAVRDDGAQVAAAGAAAALAAWFAVARDLGRPGRSAAFRHHAGSLDRMEVPAGGRVRARLGRADLTVVGPAEMEVTRAATSDMTLRLSSGTLVGDYDGRSGGRLRVETPRLVATIVGTRFAVEATPEHARVSVAHGRVAVRDAATPEGGPETFVNGRRDLGGGEPRNDPHARACRPPARGEASPWPA